MSDSLNNFIQKAGQSVSDKLSSAVLGKPVDVPGAKKHTGAYVGPGQNEGVTRTSGGDFSTNPNPSPGQRSPAVSLTENDIRYPAGFTPVSYYKNTSGEIIINPSGNPLDIEKKYNSAKDALDKFSDNATSDFKFGLSDDRYSSNWPGDTVPFNLISGKNDRSAFDGSFNEKSWTSDKNRWWSLGEGTPFENEDPVYFGFEMEIDALNSPLINGQARRFIENFGGSNTEIGSKLEILDSFIYELSKYFTFNTKNTTDSLESIYVTRLNKKHYIKKVDGLDKLIERNEANANSSFTKYKTNDLIKIQFYEDTTLSTGTLISLYKLLYWSRLNGKNIIPENLLRFDCKLVVSEARNIARVRRALGQPEPNLEVIKENVSRYVYNIYECQFIFNKMTHAASIDLGQSPAFAENIEIEMTFKFSDMKFERFVFEGRRGKYVSLSNSLTDPQSLRPIDAPDARISPEDGIIPIMLDQQPVVLEIIDGYNRFERPSDGTSTEDNPSDDILGDAKDNDFKSRFRNALSDASDKLVTNLKRAALSEAQRQLNDQFRLLNNTIDKVRNSFGIGRMSTPTNVYNNPPGGQFFFDVQNSLRNFAGDTLSGLFFGGPQ